MLATFITVFASLFTLVNPLGAVPVYLALTPDYEPAERNTSAWHTSLFVVAILCAFFWAGSIILSFFGVSIYALRIAGGLVIMLSGFSLLNGKFTEKRVNKKIREEALEKEDISFTPMAMPMLSGPGSISLLIGYFNEYTDVPNRLLITGCVFLMGVLIYMILRFSPFLAKLLGAAGLKAISRIMGFIVIAIGVQYIIIGVVQQVTSLQ